MSAASPGSPPDAGPRGGRRPLPGYELLDEIGRGGTGVVYKAKSNGTDHVVALKMILPGGHADADDLARVRSEVEAIARLHHPNIVQVYGIGEHEGRPFFALEYCPGGSLANKLRGRPQPAHEAAALVETLARAVHAAHQRQIVHRDLKPANVLLGADGTPKITDFGLAKRLDDGDHTPSGAIMGTPSYMAPEQANGRGWQVGPPADIYALGAILYELLTGRPPFEAATEIDILLQVVANEPTPPSRLRPGTPRDLEAVCLNCLQKDPQRRYASAEALADDLRRFRAGEPVRAHTLAPPRPSTAATANPPTPPEPFTARTLLYLPGLDGTARLLHRQPGLHAAYDVVCQPYPQDEPQTYDSLAGLAAAALEARYTPEHPRAVVLAESFGGGVALTLALRRPDLIERLVLVNTFAYFPWRWLIHLGSRLGAFLPPKPSNPLTRPARGFFFFPPGTPAAERKAWWERTADVPMRAFGYRLRIIAGLDLRPQLHKITLPALVVVAPNDRVVPPSAGRELARGLPNAKLVRMRTGHAALIHPRLDVARLLGDARYWPAESAPR